MEFLTNRLTLLFILATLLVSCASTSQKKEKTSQIESFESGLYLQEGEDGVIELVIPEMVEYTEVKKEAEQQVKLEQMELGSEAKVEDSESGFEAEKSSPLSLIIEDELKPDIDLRREGVDGEVPDAPVVSVPVRKKIKRKVKKAKPTPVVTSNDDYEIYVVQRRDTLYKISKKIYNTKDRWQDILVWNRETFRKDKSLKVGQELKFYKGNGRSGKTGEAYVVRKGDSLQSISRRVYGGASKHWPAIWENNKNIIENPDDLQPGFTIYTPAVEDIRKKEEERRQNPYKWEPASRSISGE